VEGHRREVREETEWVERKNANRRMASTHKIGALKLTVVYDVFLPKGVSKMLNYYRSKFYWENGQHKKNIDWSNGKMCQPKQQGSLGILDFELQNKCLLSKWLFKLYNENGI
jgi:hypothetical protein